MVSAVAPVLSAVVECRERYNSQLLLNGGTVPLTAGTARGGQLDG